MSENRCEPNSEKKERGTEKRTVRHQKRRLVVRMEDVEPEVAEGFEEEEQEAEVTQKTKLEALSVVVREAAR